jgi:hypothetical protein
VQFPGGEPRPCGNGFAVFFLLNRAQPAVADGGDGFNVAGIAGFVAEEAAEESDAAGEGVFRDGRVTPNSGEELFLRKQFLGVAKQDEKDAEGFRLDGQNFAGLPDLEFALADLDV